MRKSQFYINQLLAKVDLIALGKITKNTDELSEKDKVKLFQHDQDLHRITSRFSPYSDVQTNLVKQIEYMENYGQTVAKHVKDINSYISYELGYMNVYYYSFMVTTSNAKLSINPNGELTVTNNHGHNPFRKYHHALHKLNHYLREIHSPIRIIISAIEHTYDVYNALNPFNVHAHMLVASIGTPIKATIGRDGHNQFERYLAKYIDDEPTVTITPIHNRITGHDVVINHQSKPSDYDSITGFAKYILKQKKLPLAKTYEDLNAFKDLPLVKQRNLLVATLNSTKGVTLHGHIRYSSLVNYIDKLAYVARFIAWFHVMEANYHVQLSLFDVGKVTSTKGMTAHRKLSKHHGTGKEALFRFNGLDRYTGRPLQSHERHASRQGRSHYSHHKVDLRPNKYDDVRLTKAGHKVDKKLKMNRNHLDKQTLFNNKMVNTS